MSEQGPSILERVFPGYVYFTAIWEWELERLRDKWEGERIERAFWKDIIVLDASQPVHLEPFSNSPMDELFDELSGSTDLGYTRAASQVEDDDSSA